MGGSELSAAGLGGGLAAAQAPPPCPSTPPGCLSPPPQVPFLAQSPRLLCWWLHHPSAPRALPGPWWGAHGCLCRDAAGGSCAHRRCWHACSCTHPHTLTLGVHTGPRARAETMELAKARCRQHSRKVRRPSCPPTASPEGSLGVSKWDCGTARPQKRLRRAQTPVML